ncbi:MAG: PAS domain-containing protein [Nitrospiraceae bacterium]|nr:MAG: PAS domain-containing protein [Nitrospiraceae bacterium]
MQSVSGEISELKKKAYSIFKSTDDWGNIFHSVTDMITIHDKNFNIIFANAAAEKNLKLPNLTTKEIKCFKYYHGTVCPPEGCPSCICLKTGTPVNFEIFEPHLNKYIEIRAIPRFNSMKQVIGLIHIVRDISQRKLHEEQIERSQRKLKNLTAYLLDVREKERHHIAREIHDELAQTLTTMKMELLNLDNKLMPNQKSLHEITKSIGIAIDSAINTVQKISADLRPRLLDDLGLRSAMTWHAKKFNEQGIVDCKLNLNFKDEHISKKHAINIFRIFQESLINVVRHAHASKVKVVIKEDAENLEMTIKDDGIGITTEQISSSWSFGLLGLQERVNLCKGRIKIRGRPNEGTTVCVSVPLNSSAKKHQNNTKRLIKDIENRPVKYVKNNHL